MQIRMPAKWMLLISSLFFLLFYLMIFMVIGAPLNEITINGQKYSIIIRGFSEKSVSDIIPLNPDKINYISLLEFRTLFKEYGLNSYEFVAFFKDLETGIVIIFVLVGLFIGLIVLCLLNILIYKGKFFLRMLDILIKLLYLTLIGLLGYMFYIFSGLPNLEFEIKLNTPFTTYVTGNFFIIFIIGLFIFPTLVFIIHCILNRELYRK